MTTINFPHLCVVFLAWVHFQDSQVLEIITNKFKSPKFCRGLRLTPNMTILFVYRPIFPYVVRRAVNLSYHLHIIFFFIIFLFLFLFIILIFPHGVRRAVNLSHHFSSSSSSFYSYLSSLFFLMGLDRPWWVVPWLILTGDVFCPHLLLSWAILSHRLEHNFIFLVTSRNLAFLGAWQHLTEQAEQQMVMKHSNLHQ